MNLTSEQLAKLEITQEQVNSLLEGFGKGLELILASVRVEAIISLVFSGIELVVGFCLLRLAFRLSQKMDWNDEKDIPKGIMIMFCGLGGTVFLIIAATDFFDTHKWMAAFSPELALVQKILGVLGN